MYEEMARDASGGILQEPANTGSLMPAQLRVLMGETLELNL